MSSRRKVLGGVAGSAAAMAMAVNFIGGWEGVKTEAYQDIVGVWTICFGETRGIEAGQTATMAECREMLEDGIAEFEERLDRCLKREDEIPVGAKVAFVSWAYNVGTGAACRSTLVKKANAGDLRGACNELPRWNRAGGRVIRGLTNRRISEREMCLAALDQAS